MTKNLINLLLSVAFLFYTAPLHAQNSVEAVDLGLSVKWASCNVGASSPEEVGDYFAWGETKPKKKYTDLNYETCYNYILDLSKSNSDYLSRLEGVDDAAYMNLQRGWRMPTVDEVWELRHLCKWEPAELNGVKGMRITGLNGNSIFLPAGGRKATTILGITNLEYPTTGFYWTANVCLQAQGSAYCLYFEDYPKTSFEPRWTASPVRAVCK